MSIAPALPAVTGTWALGHFGIFEGTTEISRKDFGLTWNVALEAGGMLVGDTIKITLDVEADRQG